MEEIDIAYVYCPMTVPSSDNESEENFIKRWKKFDRLPEEIKNILSADETADKLQGIANRFSLSVGSAMIISRAIRSYYFGELKVEDFAGVFTEETSIDHQQAQEIVKSIVEKIINVVPRDRKEQAELENMKLQEALKKFEKLGEQHLSANPIKLKIFDAPVRPSIKNWISDYYEKVDARKHDSIERGNYLFHSENARRLTTGERQKVGTMLKVLDEDGVVTVDQMKQEILFGSYEAEGTENTNHKEPASPASRQITNKTQNTSTSQNTNNHGGVSFSSGHKFPYEQKTNVQAPSDQRQPLRPAMNRPQYDNMGFTPPRRQDSRPSNNVVDLRND